MAVQTAQGLANEKRHAKPVASRGILCRYRFVSGQWRIYLAHVKRERVSGWPMKAANAISTENSLPL
jgi:hypothetical protein